MRAGNDLGSGRIGVLVGRIALPSMLAQFISVLYSIVDRIFIGQIPGEGALALAGAGVCGPVVTMVGSVAFLVGVGGAPLLSIKRGEGDDDAARGILANCFLMLCVFSVALPAAILPFREPMLRLFGASDATYPYAEAYFTLYLLGTPFALLASGLNQFIVCQGFAADGMKSVVLGAVLNIVLDPVFIFAFGLGVRGAAIATVLAQVISLVWQLRILSNKQELLHFRRGIYRLRKKIVRDMLAIGMSPFLMNLAACFIVILINKGLKEYGGDLMIGAYGIVNRLAFFFVMIVLGVNQGMQPIAGYNFGAKQYDRVMRVLKLTMIGATCVTTAGFLLGEFMPRLAVGMFTSDEELIRLAVEGMRIVFFCFPIIGFQMVATNFFMSIGMAGKAIFLSLSRQLLFLMPGLIFLPHIFDVCTEWNGSWGVWCSMPLSDFLASLVAFFMLTYQLRKFRAIGAENAAKEG